MEEEAADPVVGEHSAAPEGAARDESVGGVSPGSDRMRDPTNASDPVAAITTTPAGGGRWARATPRRRRTVGWVVLGVVFAVYVAFIGLPSSEDTILIWLTAALFVSSLGDLGRWRQGVIKDWLPLYVILIIYALLRGYASHVLWGPFYRPQVDFDRVIGFGTAPTVQLQRWLYTPGQLHVWDYVCWIVYTSHFFVTYIVLAVLWKRDYPTFRRYLALFVSLTAFGYVIYVLYPALPPWLASQTGHLAPTTRIIPIVWSHVGVHAAAAIFTGGTRFDNNIAAMPSLHAAYPMLLAIFFWTRVRPRTRVLLAAYVVAMAFTLVYTAEHFFLDELVGWGCAAAVYVVGSRVLDQLAERKAGRAGLVAPAGALPGAVAAATDVGHPRNGQH